MTSKLKVKANDNTGRWEIHDSAGFLCDLESQSIANEIALAVNVHDQLVELAKSFANSIENNPDEGGFRNCCGVRFSYYHESPHSPDCKAVAALKASLGDL